MPSCHPGDVGNSAGAVECIYWIAGRLLLYRAQESGLIGASGALRFTLAVMLELTVWRSSARCAVSFFFRSLRLGRAEPDLLESSGEWLAFGYRSFTATIGEVVELVYTASLYLLYNRSRLGLLP